MTDSAIAIDMGGSHIECGIVREQHVVQRKTISIRHSSLQEALPQILSDVRLLVERSGVGWAEIRGAVIGICAVVDETGRVKATNGKYDDGLGFPLACWIEESFGVPGAVENDTRLALLGEHFAGAARGFEDGVLVTLGTGIGGAVLLGGKLLHSAGSKAGGLAGHLGVDWKGRICSCGNRGCAEAEASTWALDAICRDEPGFSHSLLSREGGRIHFHGLFQAVDAGDDVARRVLNRCLDVWSALTVSLIHAYDPRVIVFGGGIMQRHEAILPHIREHVTHHAWSEKGSITIVPGELGSSAALLGALPLLRSRT